MIHIQLQRADPQASFQIPAGGGEGARFRPFGEDGLTFGDLIDVVNPLQHIPLLSNIYRKLTGDSIDPAIRIAGGALFGGPVGAVLSAATVVIAQARAAVQATPDIPVEHVAQRPAVHSDEVPGSERRGGWMVDAAHGGSQRRPDVFETVADNGAPPVNLTTRPQTRRGGWMVIQAYGASDPRPAHTDRLESGGRIDLAV